MVQQVIKESPHGSFKVTQLCQNIVICEDIHNKQKWGNETEDQPAFMVYVGSSREESKKYVQTFNNLYGCKWCEIRTPKYLKDFECEIKVKGMSRLGLNHLVQEQNLSDYSFDFKDEIFEAAELLKQEQELIAEPEQIAKVISNWLEDQLEDIIWHYCNSPSFQKSIFKIELEQEKALTN